jgi:replicative DNA helicase
VKVDPDIDRNLDLGNRVESIMAGSREDLAKQLHHAITESSSEWGEYSVFEPISERLDHIFAPTAPAYNPGPIFKDLNHIDLNLLLDNLIVLGAEANTGKTSFMTALALGLLENNLDMCALIYSLDDGGIMTDKRIVSQLVGESMLRAHGVPRSRLSGSQMEVLSRIITRDTIDLKTINLDITAVKRVTGKEKIYIGLDYLQIIPVSGDNGAKREGYNDALKTLKDLQKRLAPQGCILVLLSQLNRDYKQESQESKSALMGRFRETSEVENQADVCLLMFPENDNPSGDDDRRIKLVVIKNKKGMRGFWWTSQLVEGHNFSCLKRFHPESKKTKGAQYTGDIMGESTKEKKEEKTYIEKDLDGFRG